MTRPILSLVLHQPRWPHLLKQTRYENALIYLQILSLIVRMQNLSPKDALKTSDSNDPSPRVSSEDSFDVVSSNNASVAGDKKPPKAEETDDDSDWE